MKVLLVLAALVAAACALHIPDHVIKSQFESFKLTHGKTYATEEEELYRSKIFKENAIKVAKHNELFAKGEVSFTVGVHKHADLHLHELVALRNGYRAGAKKAGAMVHKSPSTAWAKSSNVDWRSEGIVTPVKNQGNCGSCWAFSSTGAIEAQLAKKTGKLVSLSEQNLVDCTRGWGYWNAGCNGGLMDKAFKYVAHKGIDTEESYPYRAKTRWFCHYNAKDSVGKISGYADVNPTEQDLEHAIQTVGPVSIAIDASLWSFNYYNGGVYFDSGCGNTKYDLDHGVLAVGFGSDANDTGDSDYWIVKNSWGETWGEQGYIRIARNRNNHCGVATEASYPKV